MEFLKFFLGSICATSVMTLFSYIYEEVNNGKYKEPQLLNFLIKESALPLSPHRTHFLGWLVHYSIGLIFTLVFEILLFYQVISFSLGMALFYGFVIGFIGILGWKFMFKLSKKPENFSSISYYRHVWVAHVLFGISLGVFYTIWNAYLR